MRNGKKKAARFLRCSSFLEEKIFQLFRDLAQKTEYVDIQSLLVGLAYDSLKHSKILGEITRHIVRPDLQVNDCRKTLGQIWEDLDCLSQGISGEDKIGIEGLSIAVKHITELEDALSEGYSVFLDPEILEYIVGEIALLFSVDVATFRIAFSNLVKDKENQRTLLIEISYLLGTKKQELTGDNAPVVRYQNPNGWNAPIES